MIRRASHRSRSSSGDSPTMRIVSDERTTGLGERWWRDAALQYFQTFSGMPIPPRHERPAHSLDYYVRIRCPADEHKPRCADVP